MPVQSVRPRAKLGRGARALLLFSPCNTLTTSSMRFLETRKTAPSLKRAAGARRYAADPSTGITSVVWYFRGAWKTACPVHPHLGTHTLADLYADVRLCRRFVAHHANFDVSILRAVNPFHLICHYRKLIAQWAGHKR